MCDLNKHDLAEKVLFDTTNKIYYLLTACKNCGFHVFSRQQSYAELTQ